MHIVAEIIGFIFLLCLGAAAIAFGLLLFGFLGFMNTHNPLFIIPFALGLLIATAGD